MATKTKKETVLIIRVKDNAEGVYINGELVVASGFGSVTAWDILEALGYQVTVEENNQIDFENMPKKLLKQHTTASGCRTIT